MHSLSIALPRVLLVVLLCFGCVSVQAKTGALLPTTKARKTNDQESAIRPAQYFYLLTAVTWREYRTQAGKHEISKDWPKAIDANWQSIKAMETYKKTPIEKLIRTLPSQDDPDRRENRAGPVTQVFIDGQWKNVKGNAKLFVKNERDIITTRRIKLLLHIGKLQRDKTNELSAAESTFRLLTGKVFTKTLKQLAEQRANSLKQKIPPVESGITHYPQSPAIQELIATRKLTQSSDVKFWARMLMISNGPIRPEKEIATQLSRAIQTQSADTNTTVPPPLILITPENNQLTIKVHQPTHKVQPFYWFINPQMDVRYYAFTPPPGMAFTQATVWATRNARVTCHVTSLHKNPSDKWDFQKQEYIRYKKQNREMTKRQLQFRKDSGLLIEVDPKSRTAG